MASPALGDERHGAAEGAAAPDAFLGGRLRVHQPEGGFRAGIDTVLLAAAVPAGAGERALELGAGAGIASLCLAVRVPGVVIRGIEREPALVALATANARANGLAGRLEVEEGDAAEPLALAADAAFDHVFVNPPFTTATAGTPPATGRAGATRLSGGPLAAWIAAARAALKPGGTLTLIHRADALPEILDGLGRGFGAVVIHPLWPRAGMPAKRVILAARKGRRTPLRLVAGTVLHAPPAKYTAAVEAILRDGRALKLDPAAEAQD